MTSPRSIPQEMPPRAENLARRGRRRRNEWLIVAGVLVVLAAALAIAGRDLFRGAQSTEQGARSEEQGAGSREQGAERMESASPAPRSLLPAASAVPLVDDDGATLWASPTTGPPLDLSYLPPGPQIILAIRPAALAQYPEGEKVLAALGPIGSRAVGLVEQQTGLPIDAIDQLTIGWRTTLDGSWDATLVVTADPTVASHKLKPLLASATRERHRDRPYFVSNGSAYYQPAQGSGRVLVVASPATIREILDLDGGAPPLRRELERLLEYTDATRHVTLLSAPNFLFSDGRGMFSGQMSRLRDPLFWFLGDGAHAVALSLDWQESFFIELLAMPTLDVSPEALTGALAGRIAELPAGVEDYVLSLSPQPYGRRVVARLPEMVRKLAAYTRQGFERDHAVLRCYLPAVAGHNLLMGAELTLAEGWGGVRPAETPLAEASAPATVSERLKKRTSLRFTRDTLEAALRMLADDIGVEIVIRGPDLQAEGITKNQSFGIDVAEQSAEEILVEILRLANPDKLATGPTDPRQKLVYIISPQGPDEAEVILISTRARAAERGDSLPPVFVTGPR